VAALVLGLDSHGLAVARALADSGVPVYALKRDLRLPGAITNRVRQIFHVRSYEPTDLIPALQRVREQLARYRDIVLLTMNDRQVETVAAHLDLLLSLYRIAWADRAEALLPLQRKDQLQAHCERQGLRYPCSAVCHSVADAALVAGFEPPMILKPVRPLSSFKTLLAQSHAEVAELLRQQAHDLPILVQEYIPGDDTQLFFGALMLDRGRVVQGLVGQKLASYPPARGQTTLARTVHAPEVLALTERFFEGLGLSGPVSLELKRDPLGRHWVIEPTVGRTDFWAGLCIGAGFNQPRMEFDLACGLQPVPNLPIQDAVWVDAERDPLAWPRLCWQTRSLRPFGARPVFPFHGAGDLRPVLRAAVRLARRSLRGVRNRLPMGRAALDSTAASDPSRT
jgi:predicted ATP-grasp superfamily ATP-dependent carboligase